MNDSLLHRCNLLKLLGRLAMMVGCFISTIAVGGVLPREKLAFNSGWRFVKGDPDGAGEKLEYQNLRPWLLPLAAKLTHAIPEVAQAELPSGNIGNDVAYTQPDFNDSAWEAVTLPHDWAIQGRFGYEYPGETGKLQWWGPVWYRKRFDLSAADAGKRIVLEVDGAMAYASVWCNGQMVGGWPYGYASWEVDLTPHLKPGTANVLAIRLNAPPDSSRWYPGAGLYRNVWLRKTSPVHVPRDGVFITTPEVGRKQATVRVQYELANDSVAPIVAKVSVTIYESDAMGGRRGGVLSTTDPNVVNVAAGATMKSESKIDLANPKLWGVAHPNRYIAVTRVEVQGRVVDEVVTTFGIRTVKFTATDGLHLNGERVEIKGVCNHHDLGALGAAFNLRAAERQLEILREMGCNAIRTSHNPPAPELLELCDQMGFLVMNEAFDCWNVGKKPNDYSRLFNEWHEADLRAFIRRDRNHPSVILWSIGNEIPDHTEAKHFPTAKRLTTIAHEEDPSRLVGMGSDREMAGVNGFQFNMDVYGYNYRTHYYNEFRKVNPHMPIMGSETASTVSSRGEYFFPVSNDKASGRQDFQMSSYDLYAPPWAWSPDVEFERLDKSPFVMGEFVWTGFDYLGEPTPYTFDESILTNFSDPVARAKAEQELKQFGKVHSPSRSSYFGIIDLAGFPKDRYYIYQARWRPQLPMVHILPHWNWPERVGEVTPVHVYTSGDEAELFLNGKSLGRKAKGRFEYRLRWDDVKYQPGLLKVVAYKNGKKWANGTMKTAGVATKISLSVDRPRIKADGKDLSYVTVRLEDDKGTLVPRSSNLVKFSIEGTGEIVAVDNGDATSFESFQAKERRAYNGLALVIVRATGPGKIRLVANSDGLCADEAVIQGMKAK